MKKLLVLTLLSLSLTIYAQNDELRSMMKERDEYYFSFEMNDKQQLEDVEKYISIDKVEGHKVVAYANNKGYERFLALGLDATLLTPPSMLEEHKMFDGRTRAEYNWDEYPTYDAYVALMEEFAKTYPEKCTLIELGTLESGRKILLVRINDGNPEGKPKFLYGSTIHGDETTGFVMLLRLIDVMLTQPELPEVKNVLDNIDLFICPNANPDGTYYAGNHTVTGARRFNIDGIDMNRNYPDPIDGPHPDYEEYAMETQWFMQLAEDYQFTMAAHYHGGAEVMNYPWDNNYERHVDDAWWQYVCREYADLVHEKNTSYMTDLNDGITNGSDWYTISGGRQDYMNYYQQCRELTIECSADKCPQASKIKDYWDYNYEAMFSFMNQCANGIHGKVHDSFSDAVEATITIVGVDEEYSIVDSQYPYGDFHRPIKAGTYTVEIKSDGYTTVYETVEIADGERVDLDIEMIADEAYNMYEGTVVTKGAYFYDSGGPDGNYPDNDFHVMTFKPGVKGAMIQIEFVEFSTEENYDIIRVYDGTSVGGAPCVAVLSGTTLPEPITATNEEGALTFRFLSDFMTNDKGWKAIIRCIEYVGVTENEYSEVLSVFPNPAKDIINVEINGNDEISSWMLHNVHGQLIMQSKMKMENNAIEVGNIVPGLYFITVNTDKKQFVRKIVIE